MTRVLLCGEGGREHDRVYVAKKYIDISQFSVESSSRGVP
jgi:hypothetical protein